MKQRGQIFGPQKQRITVRAVWKTMLLFLYIKTPLPCFCPMKNGINRLQTKTREDSNMQFLKFTATLMDKEWIEGNKDRETYREYKT